MKSLVPTTLTVPFLFSPLTEEQLIYARKRRQMEIRLKLFLQDFLSYLLFLTFLFLVVRGYRDPNEYYFRKALQDDVVHRHFTSVSEIHTFYFTFFVTQLPNSFVVYLSRFGRHSCFMLLEKT